MSATTTIARLTIREAQRRRILWVALITAVVFLLVFGISFNAIHREVLREGSGFEELNLIFAVLLTAGMYATNLLVSLVAVLVSVTTISGEIESHVMDAIVTKPINRWEILLGKWMALAVLVVCYLLLLAGGLMLIVYLQSGYRFEQIGAGLLMMALAALLVLTLTIAGGTRLSTLANGVLAFMLFGIAFLGGFVEQIGGLIRNEAAVNVGIVTSLILPADALWRKALTYFQPRQFSSMEMAGPFASTTEPSALMIVYAVVYLAGVFALALLSFSRRDL